MFGKGTFIIVIGFTLALSVYQLKLTKSALSVTDNFNREYVDTKIHESTLSAMNIGITKVWETKVKDSTFSVVINNCSTDVVIGSLGMDSIYVKAVSRTSVFDEQTYNQSNTSLLLKDSVIAYFAYNTPASRFFWFTSFEGNIFWITGDTVWGPLHTNGVLHVSGSPVFFGKVTTLKGIDPLPGKGSNHGKFYGGWEIGVDNKIPTDMSHLYNAAVAGNAGAPPNTKSIYDTETTFEFLSDGKVIRQVGSSPPDTVALEDIAPTGVIYSYADVRVKGAVNGKVTIYSNDDIWIDDDVVCADDPLTNPNSNDYIGLVANDNVIITDNYANNHDVNIQAAIMAINGSMFAENYYTRPVAGELRITGSIVQNSRGPVGTFWWWSGTIRSGFSKRYRFDNRFKFYSPPYYPYVRQLRLVSWWE